MDKTLKVTGLAGLVSAVIALITLAINVSRIRSDIEKAETNEWQEVTAFSAIVDAKIDGLTFDQIQHDYTIKAKDLPEELPRTENQTRALKRILLSLISKRAISIRSDGRYGIALDGIAPAGVSMLDAALRMEPVGDAVLQIVSKEPGRYTVTELFHLLKGRFQFSNEEFDRLLMGMRLEKALQIDANGKVSGMPFSPTVPPANP